MYDVADPRSRLALATDLAPPADFSDVQFGLFYATEPQILGPGARTWCIRGQNFVVAYSETAAEAVLERRDQPDEYVLLIPDRETSLTVESGGKSVGVEGYSLVIVPPGDSRIVLPAGGRIVRLLTALSKDLAEQCANARAFAEPSPIIPPFKPWPAPADGFRIRVYSLDIPPKSGRFGRIIRCTTFMVNYLEPQFGPRDVTKLSPHSHDEFEQASLVLEGAFTHHLRWPWTTNLNNWREDIHAECESPSATVIPPRVIHTSRGITPNLNQIVDVFAPPRLDFSSQPGWVLNADEYPMPSVS